MMFLLFGGMSEIECRQTVIPFDVDTVQERIVINFQIFKVVVESQNLLIDLREILVVAQCIMSDNVHECRLPRTVGAYYYVDARLELEGLAVGERVSYVMQVRLADVVERDVVNHSLLYFRQ